MHVRCTLKQGAFLAPGLVFMPCAADAGDAARVGAAIPSDSSTFGQASVSSGSSTGMGGSAMRRP